VLTTVLEVAVLLPGVTSLGDETVAVLLIEAVPVPPGAVTFTTIAGVVAPTDKFAARVQVTVPETWAQLQLASVPANETNVAPAGKGSVTLTPEAGSGPGVFATLIV
jgi:hypothetical protein